MLMVALGVTAVALGETKITGGRFWHGPEKTRMVFDISEATTFQAFVLTALIVSSLISITLSWKADYLNLKEVAVQ